MKIAEVSVNMSENNSERYEDKDINMENEPKEEGKKTNWRRELLEWIEAFAIAIVVGLLLNHFVFTIVEVQGDSMVPTLHSSDRLIVLSRYISKIDNGDIIVFRPEHDKNKPYIKRVIAVGGQTVDIDSNSRIIVDGKVLEEDYVSQYRAYRGDMQFPLKVDEGTYFVMGDNRPSSKDSRMKEVGLVKHDSIIGKAVLRWFPFQQFTVFDKVEY